jgi:hypothetical protein
MSACLQNNHLILNGSTLLVKDAWWYQHLLVSNLNGELKLRRQIQF